MVFKFGKQALSMWSRKMKQAESQFGKTLLVVTSSMGLRMSLSDGEVQCVI